MVKISDESTPDARDGAVPPVAAGVRLAWSAVPADLREEACAFAGGGEVVEAVSQSGGFSPGAAVRVRLSTGRRLFVKAVSGEQNPDSPGLYRSEAQYAAALPVAAPAPRLLGAIDERGWVVLVFEDIDGVMPAAHWPSGELSRVLDAFTDLATLLDPSPVQAPGAAERLAGAFQGWRTCLRLRDEQSGDPLRWLDPWAQRHLEALAGLEERSLEAMGGTALCHGDLRADNILLTDEGVYFVDWPWANIGAPWVDLVLMAPSVWMHGGPEAARRVYEHPLVAKAAPDDVTAVAAAFVGYCLERGHQPPPPGLPTIRAYQSAVGAAGLEWIKTRLGDWP
jgi:aminoglycoside phosphotransferase (APT) family kinase protein